MKPTVIAMALLALTSPALAAPLPDAKLLAAVKACDKDARALEEKVVAIDSGSADREGVVAVGAVFAGELEALGATVKAVPSAPGGPWGDNVVATFTGTGKGRILLIAHTDTVFSKGDVARLKPH